MTAIVFGSGREGALQTGGDLVDLVQVEDGRLSGRRETGRFKRNLVRSMLLDLGTEHLLDSS